jgi:biotin carboxyl carrier protein
VTMPEYEALIDGKPRRIELTRNGESSFTIKLDGKTRLVELVTGKTNFGKPLTVNVDGKTYKVELPLVQQGKEFSLKVDEATFKTEVRVAAKKAAFTTFEPVMTTPARRAVANKQVVEGAVTAPMTGKIVSVKVKKGDQVKAGQVLCVVEAMKMENEITSSKAGAVKEVYISEGASVSEGEPLFSVG